MLQDWDHASYDAGYRKGQADAHANMAATILNSLGIEVGEGREWQSVAAEAAEAVRKLKGCALRAEAERDRLLGLINSPEIDDFMKGVHREAIHQHERWHSEYDKFKAKEDWFWLLGYLGGKVLRSLESGNAEKAKHHTITAAAMCANWFLAIGGRTDGMRPGWDPRGLIDESEEERAHEAASTRKEEKTSAQ